MGQDNGASANADRATAAEPVVSALRDGIPSARDMPLASCCLPGGPCYEAGLSWVEHKHDWQTSSPWGLEAAIVAFKEALPGYWFTVGECQVSADASCGPTRESPDIALISLNRAFDDGFHADLPQPATLAQALANVQAQAIEARRAETATGSVHESAVATPCAQPFPPSNSETDNVG